MNRLMILGTNIFALEMADLIGDVEEYELVGFVENQDKNKCGDLIVGKPVVWIDNIKDMVDTCEFICSIGTTHRISYIEQVKAMGGRFIEFVHPTAYVSKTGR